MIKNYMEILVDEVYSEIKGSYKKCICPNYDTDIKSIALNNLTPKYFLSSDSEGKKRLFY